ncbi:MAG: hypothetical protein Q9165_003616 [Trypethelium subeluteriae]
MLSEENSNVVVETSSQGSGNGWYMENVNAIPPRAKELLEKYSKIPSDQGTESSVPSAAHASLAADFHAWMVLLTLNIQRDKAFTIWNYACIGQLRFLTPNLPKVPVYTQVLEKLRDGATLLDAGCCFGQEIRYLVEAGIPSSQLYGFDLEMGFIDLGFELFRDRTSLQAHFFDGDLLASPSTLARGNLDLLHEQADIIFASSLLHVWDLDDMMAAAKQLVSFTKPKLGSTIIGRQMGTSGEARTLHMPTKKGSNYRHNLESMSRFWVQVGEETSTEWRFEGGLSEGEQMIKANMNHAWSEPNMCMLWFMVSRK